MIGVYRFLIKKSNGGRGYIEIHAKNTQQATEKLKKENPEVVEIKSCREITKVFLTLQITIEDSPHRDVDYFKRLLDSEPYKIEKEIDDRRVEISPTTYNLKNQKGEAKYYFHYELEETNLMKLVCFLPQRCAWVYTNNRHTSYEMLINFDRARKLALSQTEYDEKLGLSRDYDGISSRPDILQNFLF